MCPDRVYPKASLFCIYSPAVIILLVMCVEWRGDGCLEAMEMFGLSYSKFKVIASPLGISLMNVKNKLSLTVSSPCNNHEMILYTN